MQPVEGLRVVAVGPARRAGGRDGAPTPEVVKGKRWCAAKRGESRQKREG